MIGDECKNVSLSEVKKEGLYKARQKPINWKIKKTCWSKTFGASENPTGGRGRWSAWANDAEHLRVVLFELIAKINTDGLMEAANKFVFIRVFETKMQ